VLCNSDKYSEGYTLTAKLARFIGHVEARRGIAPNSESVGAVNAGDRDAYRARAGVSGARVRARAHACGALPGESCGPCACR